MDLGMSIANLATNVAESNTMQAVSTEVLDMSLDNMQTQGAAMVDMLESSISVNSVYSHIGGNIDILA